MRIAFFPPVLEVFQSLPATEQEAIVEKLELLQHFPYMYEPWSRSRRFRRYRQFVAGGNCRIFYRVSDNVIWLRGLWPARLPVQLARRQFKQIEE